MSDDPRIEVGVCRQCATPLLVRLEAGHPVAPAAPNNACRCGGDEFDRVSVDEAFSHVGTAGRDYPA